MAKKKKPLTKRELDRDLEKFYDHLDKQTFESEEELKAFLAQTSGKKLGDLVPKKKDSEVTDKERAEAVLDGIEDLDFEARESQAKKALAIYPNLVDGHLWLAYCSDTREKSLTHFEQAVAAGREEIGPEEFEKMKGHFWGFHQTRSFMRAKAEYAMVLREAKKYEQSILQFKELLELNPNDNQGLRFSYAALLIQTGKYLAYEKLMKDYEEENMAQSLFTYAIYCYKKHGNSVKSNHALAKAHVANPYFLKILLGEVEPSQKTPTTYSLGSIEEAQLYLEENFSLFHKDKKMALWLAKFLRKHS